MSIAAINTADKTHIKFFKMRTIFEMKFTLDGIGIRLHTTEDIISEFEG